MEGSRARRTREHSANDMFFRRGASMKIPIFVEIKKHECQFANRETVEEEERRSIIDFPEEEYDIPKK
jgi:hypothetical protein